MEPIHDAALEGNLAAINRLVEEDGRRLNAQVQGEVILDGDGDNIEGSTPLVLAASEGHDAVMARLLELGADVELVDADGWPATQLAVVGQERGASTLALLLEAGASFTKHDNDGFTPLMYAAHYSATECVELLLARGGDALELDAPGEDGVTALHCAANSNNYKVVKLLLQAGVDPTVRDRYEATPLMYASETESRYSVALLQAALAEPQRPRHLLKARALIDAAHAVQKARSDARTRAEEGRAAVAAAPTYLKGREAEGRQLPAVTVKGKKQELVACVEYALEGMVKDLFVELCELMVPKWDPANV